jgi:chromosomal replication initiator protein
MAHVASEVLLSGGFVDHFAIIKESILSKSHAASDRALLDQLEISEEDGSVFVRCPNVFAQKYLNRIYKDLIVSTIRTCLDRHVNVEFCVSQPDEIQDRHPAPSTGKPVQMSLPPFAQANACSGLNAHFTFDEFVVGRCNAFAYEAAQAVSDGSISRYNPLYFHSDVGLGKSHISHAIGNKILSERPGTCVNFTTARDFTQDYVHSVRNNCLSTFKSSYRSHAMDIFFIDDVHLFKNKEKTQVELCHVLDDLISAGKQVVLSGFRPPTSIPQIDKGLRSRFSSGLVIDIKRPDKATRAKIVRHKARKNGVTMPDVVVEFISDTIHTSVRDLESAVMTIAAMSSLMKRPVTIDLARELLEGTLEKQQRITIPFILDFISKSFSVPKEKLVSPSRKKEIVYPRQVAIFLCRRYTEEPLQVIGEAFSRKHSSIIHSLETIDAQYTQNLKVKREIDFLIDRLDGESS